MIGKTRAHYQVAEKLGERGMDVVYDARDTRFDRFVAFKTLPPEGSPIRTESAGSSRWWRASDDRLWDIVLPPGGGRSHP